MRRNRQRWRATDSPEARGNGRNGTADRRTLTALPALHANASRRPRIALYSHDTMGLGHMRRNMVLAQALAESQLKPDILLIAGAREAASFPLPDGVDCLTLPALFKSARGTYSPRHLRMSLPELIAIRTALIRSALDAFQPDLLMVDNVPRGAACELDLVLESLCEKGRTRCVLGLRDVLDHPVIVQREWSHARNDDAIRAWYDAIWVYGDAAVYDPVQEYGFQPDIAARVQHVGYLDQRRRVSGISVDSPHPLDGLNLPDGALVVCLVGGGQDGARLAEAFAQTTLPADTNAVLLTGPYMPRSIRERLQAVANGYSRLHVVEFLDEPCRLWERADRVITMGGYNSVCEALSFGTPTLVIPRVVPRQEQLIRATRLRDLGLIDMLHPHELTPAALSNWLHQSGSMSATRVSVDLSGLDRVPEIAGQLLNLTHLRATEWGGFDRMVADHAASAS